MFVCVPWRRRGTRVCAWLGSGGRGRGSEVKDGCGRPYAVFRSTIVKRHAGAAASRFSRLLRGLGALGRVEVMVKRLGTN